MDRVINLKKKKNKIFTILNYLIRVFGFFLKKEMLDNLNDETS